MSVIDGVCVMGGDTLAESISNRISRLGILRDGLEHAQNDGLGCILDHVVAQLGGNSSLAQIGVGQPLGVDLGVNGLDLRNQLGAGSYQRVNVDFSGFL